MIHLCVFMPHGHKLVQQSLVVNAVALGTLAARTAIILNSQLATTFRSTFLAKRVRYLLQYTGRTINDDGPIVVMISKGDLSLSEVTVAMQEHNTLGPSDTTESLTEDTSWAVYQNTVKTFQPRGDGTEAVFDSGWTQFNGSKGIPILEDLGLLVHAYNTGAGALTTGGAINGIVQIQGVWLRD